MFACNCLEPSIALKIVQDRSPLGIFVTSSHQPSQKLDRCPTSGGQFSAVVVQRRHSFATEVSSIMETY